MGIISSLAGIISLLIGGVIGALITTAGLLLLGGIEKYLPLSEQDGFEWYFRCGLILLLVFESLHGLCHLRTKLQEYVLDFFSL